MPDVVPGFTYRQIPTNFSHQNWASTGSLGMVLHVAVGGDVSLYGWFSNPAARASSHWWAGKSGGREQYLDPMKHRSWAQAAGNDEYHSIETSGNPDEALSSAQIDAAAAAYAWGHLKFGWPFQLAEKPGQLGLGWHGMGGSAWGGHTGCPGDLRKAQRPEILRRAQLIVNGGGSGPLPPESEDDMSVWNSKDGRNFATPLAVPAGKWTPVPICAASDLWGWDVQRDVFLNGGVHFNIDLPDEGFCRARFRASDRANALVYTWPDEGEDRMHEQFRPINTILRANHQLGFEVFTSVPTVLRWTKLELNVFENKA